MTYDTNAARKGGSRKHLIEEVIKRVDEYKRTGHAEFAMLSILSAVRRYQKEMGK